MNLLFVDQFSDLGGAQLCLLELLPEVRARGWKAVVAAPGTGPLLERSRELGAAVENLQARVYGRGRKTAADVGFFIPDLVACAKHIGALIHRYAADILYVNGPRIALSAGWARPTSVPFVYHCHSFVPQPYGAGIGWCLALARATVIANSRFTAASLARCPEPHIIYNGVADYSRTRPPRERPRVGIIGRIEPLKGQLEFVQAARVLVERGRSYDFEVCGAAADSYGIAYERTVRQAAAGLPIEFGGWSQDVGAALARMDVLVVPSTGAEATTRVILEAYSAGVPVIACRTGGIPEVVAHGDTGVLIDSAEPIRIADAVDRLLNRDGREREAISRAARAAWESRFTLERYRREILDLVASCPRGFKRLQQMAKQ
jgi:glycosyltransferase involved in cell wall biosynthesis